MTHTEALKLALEALGKWSSGRDMDAVELNDLIATLEAALEQPEQEPMAWMYVGIKHDGTTHGPHLVWKPEHMDAMSAEKGVKAVPLYAALKGGRQSAPSPEQPEQEPVAWQWLNTAHFRKKLPADAEPRAWNPLYTHPPRRETEPAAFGALVAISLLTHLGGEVADYEDVVEAVRRLHALNGELLEALKQMLEVWEEDPAYGAKHADKARAAVIRARGQA